jgi:hypothetical protein
MYNLINQNVEVRDAARNCAASQALRAERLHPLPMLAMPIGKLYNISKDQNTCREPRLGAAGLLPNTA